MKNGGRNGFSAFETTDLSGGREGGVGGAGYEKRQSETTACLDPCGAWP